jgi:hypothetical protein
MAARNVKMIVFPTTSAWRSFETYAALFPEARLLCAGPIPDAELDAVPGSRARVEMLGMPDQPIQLTRNIRLLRVRGDDHTNEFLLHHEGAKTLACSELYHGYYADFDPCNTWLCRAWFKFQKEGDYKRVDIVPKFKLDQIEKGGSMELVRDTIDELSELELGLLISSHGTQPIDGHPIQALRHQWGMAPLETVKHVDMAATYNNVSAELMNSMRPRRSRKERDADAMARMPTLPAGAGSSNRA